MEKISILKKIRVLISSFLFFAFLLFFFFFLPQLHAQKQTVPFDSSRVENLILEKSIPLQAEFFSVDNLGNIYTVKGGQLYKYSSLSTTSSQSFVELKPVNTYSSKLLGNITSIDVSNPMKSVLFYKNLSQVVFLDNTLSPQRNPIELENMGLESATLICSSVNSGIWVYDQRNFQLVRLDENLKIIVETGSIIQQAGGELNPNFLLEKNNQVYLNDTARGILLFDIFGTYSKTIPLKNITGFAIFDDVLFFEREKKFFVFFMKTMEQKEIVLPEKEFKQVITDGKKLFVLLENELRIYSGKPF